MSPLALHELHASLDARFAELSGFELVADYGDPAGEYAALGNSAGVIDLGFRGRMCLTGADRVRLLHGQVTNDVQKLATGQGCYAALVSAKGRVECDLNIYALADELLLDFEPGLTTKLSARFDHYIVADDVQIVDVAPYYGLFSVQGPRAAEVVQALGVFPTLPDRAFGLVHVSEPSLGELYLCRRPRCSWPSAAGGIPGFDLFIPTDALGMVFDKVVAAARQVGGRAVGWSAVESRRIEGGVPRFGADIDETNLAPEAGDAFVAHAINYAKGCYIGQEVIARIRTYGQVAKALRGLRFVEAGLPLPAKGDKVFKDGKEVGVLTSVLHSTAVKAVIALAYVRRESHAPGTELIVRSTAGEHAARIVPLPFQAAPAA